MEIALKNAGKPLRSLRRTLERLPDDPSAKQVHALRTQLRRLEAVVSAFMLDRKKKIRHMLKAVGPMRKAAGGVRDMDVMAGKVLALAGAQTNDSLVRLVEHLREMRIESARELHDTIASHRKSARRSLRDCAKLIEKQFPGNRQVIASDTLHPVRLTEELVNWPRLNADNIHDFRIKLKQLLYILQLADTADREILDDLAEVKEKVGDWHDWEELARIARQALDPHHDRAALKKIAETGKRKFERALESANAVRRRYFKSTANVRPKHKASAKK